MARLVLTSITLACLSMTMSACSIVSDDPSHRTPGVIIDDNVLEGLVEQEIRKSDRGYKGSHIIVVSFNGLVLLAGQVPNEALRTKASEVTGRLKRVTKVYNELNIGGPISMLARTNDSWLTSKVKTRLLASSAVDGNKIKVQTENGVVYLLGLTTRAKADAAIEVASQIYGIQKIVKVFEYLD